MRKRCFRLKAQLKFDFLLHLRKLQETVSSRSKYEYNLNDQINIKKKIKKSNFDDLIVRWCVK